MARTVACLVLKTAKVFTWLGHMPIMTWSLMQLREVRGITRIVCIPETSLTERAKKLLGKEDVEVFPMPREIATAKDRIFNNWLTAANGPAADADVVVVTKATSPFMPATKIEACVTQVTKGKCAVCVPSRSATVTMIDTFKRSTSQEAVDGFRVFKVNVPTENMTYNTIKVNLMESLDVDNHDEFVLASALVDSDKV